MAIDSLTSAVPSAPRAGGSPRTVALLQSNYIPWKGYFDIIHDVDLFIFYDDVQYTWGDWRNRNRIKTPYGLQWLTVPVGKHNDRLICEVTHADHDWQEKHWRLLQLHYRKARYFEYYRPVLEPFYLEHKWDDLSTMNQALIRTIAVQFLGVTTAFARSQDYAAQGHKQERVLDIVRKTGAPIYLSGPAAKAYLDPALFQQHGIEVRWKDYSDYPEYTQFHPPFNHAVTILDLLFHEGPRAPWFIWGHRSNA
jgi:hypothetical protein